MLAGAAPPKFKSEQFDTYRELLETVDDVLLSVERQVEEHDIFVNIALDQGVEVLLLLVTSPSDKPFDIKEAKTVTGDGPL